MVNLYERITHTKEIGILWYAVISEHIPKILNLCPGITDDEIGFEHFRIHENGDGEIYIQIRDYEIRLRVAKDKWWWN